MSGSKVLHSLTLRKCSFSCSSPKGPRATQTEDLSSIYLLVRIPTTWHEPKVPKDCAKYLHTLPKGYKTLTILRRHETEPQEREDEMDKVIS